MSRASRARILAGIFFTYALCLAEGFGQGANPAPDFPIDARVRAEVIAQALEGLRASYVFPEVATAMTASIEAKAKEGAYDKLETAAAFAAQLTTDLQAVSRDKHLRVRHSVRASTAQAGESESRSSAIGDLSVNHGFHKVERLAGNIGYIDLRSFSSAQVAGEKAAAAMKELAGTDALVIDLRRNGGGSAGMVALLASYLLEGEPILLNSFVGRSGNVISETWTQKDLPAPRYAADKEIYLLTSSYTFSAAEEFAYDLTNLKRATLIGETTGGGANPVGVFPVIDGFKIIIPTARALNPITKTNWEGVGVKPDVDVPAKLALPSAHLAALKKLAADDPQRAKANLLQEAMEQVARELDELHRS